MAVELVEDAVETDAHLIGEGIAGDVIGRLGRAARIFGIVRMILRLEHVEDMGAIRLRRAHDIGSRRIGLAAGAERGIGALDFDPGLDEGVEEGDGGRQVGLVGGDDIGARIALGGNLDQRLILERRVDLLRSARPRLVMVAAAIGLQRCGVGQPVDLGRRDRPAVLLPFSMLFVPIRQMLSSSRSRLREA